MEIKNTKCMVFDPEEPWRHFHSQGDLPKGQGRSWQPDGQPFLWWIEENDKRGGVEVHMGLTDAFVILKGEPVFLVGGELVNPVEKSPGELRAVEIRGGEKVELTEGDIFSVPAGTPHQRLANGEIFLLVFKIPTGKK